MNNKISDKDKKSWEDFLKSNEKVPNKDFEQTKNTKPKLIHIDLHGYTLKDANIAMMNCIEKAYENHVTKIIVVTGKGRHSNVENDPYVSKDLSILKYSVPEFLKNNSELKKKIVEIKDADIEDGGSGAFYIFLKKKL